MTTLTSSNGTELMGPGASTTITYDATVGYQTGGAGVSLKMTSPDGTSTTIAQNNGSASSGVRLNGVYTFTPTEEGVYVFELWGYLQAIQSSATIATLTITYAPYYYTTEELYKVTVSHSLSATATNAVSIQWQESTDGEEWVNINGETSETLSLGTWIDVNGGKTEAEARAKTYAIIPSYGKYYRCIAINGDKTTVSNILHVVHEAGNGTPSVI